MIYVFIFKNIFYKENEVFYDLNIKQFLVEEYDQF